MIVLPCGHDPDLLGKYHDLNFTLTRERLKCNELIAALERAMDFTSESETRANIAEDLLRITGSLRPGTQIKRPDIFDQVLADMDQNEIDDLPTDTEVNARLGPFSAE